MTPWGKNEPKSRMQRLYGWMTQFLQQIRKEKEVELLQIKRNLINNPMQYIQFGSCIFLLPL